MVEAAVVAVLVEQQQQVVQAVMVATVPVASVL
jgi:hypothetical protein